MKQDIRLPQLSPNMEEAVLVAWQKQVGDRVERGEVLYEVETDKVISEVESDYTGILLTQLVEEGDRVSPDQVVATIEV